jgi:hypothetical protein
MFCPTTVLGMELKEVEHIFAVLRRDAVATFIYIQTVAEEVASTEGALVALNYAKTGFLQAHEALMRMEMCW